jgi:hypothetical protein
MTHEEAYGEGFAIKCAEAGIDPAELMKFAKTMVPAPTDAEKAQFKAKVQAKKAPAKKGPIAQNLSMKKDLLKD